MSHWPMTTVHISMIRAGDTVIHRGREMTVGANDIKRDRFMGPLLFGDCYRLGQQKVQRVEITRALPNR